MKAVAIVGAAKQTRSLAPYDDPSVEIWTMNEAAKFGWIKRIDALFQLHQRWVFTRENNTNDPQHWQWLQQPHEFPIFMLKQWRDVPSSLRYPFEEVVETVRPVRKYFTSTIPYMIALAIYLEYDEIGIYGVEMAAGTEYAFQRDCVMYWIGKADGLGINIALPSNSSLMKARLYGYEGDRMLSRHFFERRAEALSRAKSEASELMQKAGGRVQLLAEQLAESDESDLELQQQFEDMLAEERELLAQVASIAGAQSENEYYLKEYDKMIAASGIESKESYEED